MAVKIISPSDKSARVNGSYSREVVKMGKTLHGVWMGYAIVKAGGSYGSLDILIPAQQRGVVDTTSFVIDANSRITSVGIRPRTALTLGTATGKLKFAIALNAATTALYVETAAASGGVLAIAPPVETINITSVTVGTSDVTFKIFATDGGVAGAAVASTLSSAIDTFIDVEIGFTLSAPFPTVLEVGKAAPPVI